MFGDKLKEARMAKGLKQSELGDLLNLKNTTISNWEKGVSNPNVEVVSKLCSILNVSASYFFDDMASEEILSFSEKEHIKKYRSLSDYDKGTVDQLLDRLSEKEPEPLYTTVTKPNYLTGLSAGTGLFVFDDVPCDQIEVPIEYKDIDFVIAVSGDSMEPDYSDGDKVMIKKGEVRVGEIGAFMVNGEAYIKERGVNELISHNREYANIKLQDDMKVECIGKVVGKII